MYFSSPFHHACLGGAFPRDRGGLFHLLTPMGFAMPAFYIHFVDHPLLTLPWGRISQILYCHIPISCPPHSIAERGHLTSMRGIAVPFPYSFSPALSSGRGWALGWPLLARPMVGLPGLAGPQGSRCPFPGPTGISPWSPPCARGCGCPHGAAGRRSRSRCRSPAPRAEARTPCGGGARLAARPSRGPARPGLAALPGAPLNAGKRTLRGS